MLDPILFWMISRVSEKQSVNNKAMTMLNETHLTSQEMWKVMMAQHQEIRLKITWGLGVLIVMNLVTSLTFIFWGIFRP